MAIQCVDVALPFSDLIEPVYVDLKSGRVYEISAGSWVRRGGTAELRGLPVYDSPVLIASRADLRFR
jgi:hypothetical protein